MTLKCTNNIMDIFLATTSIKTYMGKIQKQNQKRIFSYNVSIEERGAFSRINAF